jgi:RNA polymerase sigma-70 factor, ECF subfamily
MVFDAQSNFFETDESPSLVLVRETIPDEAISPSRFDTNTSSSYVDCSDVELMIALVARNEEAFNELFRRHQSSVAASSRMIVGNGTECEDVTAEVFIGLWLDPSKFDSTRGSLLTYLRMQSKGRSIDMVRSESTRVRRETNVGRRTQCPDEEIGTSVLAAETATHLRHAISMLPTDEREPIELAFFSGMTYCEAARFLAIAEGTLKSRVRRGLEHLRRSFEVQSRMSDNEDGHSSNPALMSLLHDQNEPR